MQSGCSSSAAFRHQHQRRSSELHGAIIARLAPVCRQSRTLSDAGRVLFQSSRTQRTVVNDADRLRKYLARFGLDWERASGAGR